MGVLVLGINTYWVRPLLHKLVNGSVICLLRGGGGEGGGGKKSPAAVMRGPFTDTCICLYVVYINSWHSACVLPFCVHSASLFCRFCLVSLVWSGV